MLKFNLFLILWKSIQFFKNRSILKFSSDCMKTNKIFERQKLVEAEEKCNMFKAPLTL